MSAEARNALELHLDPAREPAVSIRAVYGQWLPILFHLDAEWTEAHLPAIFPTDESKLGYWNAAWSAYVTMNKPYTNVFHAMIEQYRQAIAQLDPMSGNTNRLRDPDRHLTEHLLEVYWQGNLPLNDPNGLLANFFERASAELRGHALEFVGRSMANSQGDIPTVVLERLQQLLDWRIQSIRTARPSEESVDELVAIGWWFSSGKLDDSWAMVRLNESFTLLAEANADKRVNERGLVHLVLERLNETCTSLPLESVTVLEAALGAYRSGHLFSTWREHTNKILRAALDSGDERAQSKAREVIHRLGARGHLEFGELLNN